jgi:hypothetical protein
VSFSVELLGPTLRSVGRNFSGKNRRILTLATFRLLVIYAFHRAILASAIAARYEISGVEREFCWAGNRKAFLKPKT